MGPATQLIIHGIPWPAKRGPWSNSASFGGDVEIRVKPTNYRSVRLDVDAGALSEP